MALTPDEEKEMAALDAKIADLDDRMKGLAFEKRAVMGERRLIRERDRHREKAR